MIACPCGGKHYARCCEPYHTGMTAPDAYTLMRSRYSAYVLRLEDYLLATWHSGTRPDTLDLAPDTCKWLGLEIKRHEELSKTAATVEFVARYRIAGKGHRLHEISRFVLENGRWWYLDGDLNE